MSAGHKIHWNKHMYGISILCMHSKYVSMTICVCVCMYCTYMYICLEVGRYALYVLYVCSGLASYRKGVDLSNHEAITDCAEMLTVGL